jgi:hypothetical protein
MTILETLDTGSLLSPAPVDNEGRVTGPSTGTLELEFTDDFITAMEEADKLIVTFTLNTTDNGTKDVKIYSDYSISFKVAVEVKADINLNLNSDNN